MKPTTETVSLLDPKTVLISKLNTRQPKKADVAELMETIKNSGQITPAIARPHPTKPGHFELAAGARRKVACEALKIQLKCVIRALTDTELEDMILIDNLQREDPDPMSEAVLIERRLAAGAQPSEIAAKYGKSETWLKRRMKLIGLTEAAREAWKADGNMEHYTTEMMEYVGTLPEMDQNELAANHWDHEVTLAGLIQQTTRSGHDLEGVAWLDDPCSFITGCGPGCATDTAKGLFPDPEATCGTCLNSACFRKRQSLVRAAKMADALASRPLTDFIVFRGSGYSDTFSHDDKNHKCLPSWKLKEHYTVAQKAGPSTLLGLDVGDPDQPAVVHLKRKATSKDDPADAPAVGQKDSREDRLTGKRLAVMNQLIDNEVTDAKIPAGISMLRLAAAFGMNSSRSYQTDEEAWHSLDSGGKVPSFGYQGGESTPEQVVWDTIRPILRKRLNFQAGKELLAEHRRNNMVRTAMLLGMDYEDEWRKICEKDVPVPKSWGEGIDPVTLVVAAVSNRQAPAKPAKKPAKTQAA
jgi:ParB/RepB/Spo0J family partition protein